MTDIDILQLSSNEEIFKKGAALFVKKWSGKKQKTFVEYMNSEWFGSHCNWFEGAALDTPSTNNGQEAFHNVVKTEETLRERLPLSRYLAAAKKSVESWSKDYETGLKVFHTSKVVQLSDWTSGYQWAKANRDVQSSESENSLIFYCPAGNEVSVKQEHIDMVQGMRYNTFKQFSEHAFKVWIVEMPKENDRWIEGKCTCPQFFKKFMCKHLVGIAIRLKFAKPPPAAKVVPIGEKRRRGRPKKATRALVVA